MDTLTLKYTKTDPADPNGDPLEVELVVPARWEVCGDCDGHGSTLRESLRGGFTESEFNECFDDEESREQYFMRGGIYDEQCKTCRGRTTVLVPNEAAMSDEQRAALAEWEEDQQERAREERNDRAVRRAECGYRD